MKQKIDHYGEKEMAPLSPTDRGNKRRRRLEEPFGNITTNRKGTRSSTLLIFPIVKIEN